MTPAELEAIRARVEKATPGPWRESGNFSAMMVIADKNNAFNTKVAVVSDRWPYSGRSMDEEQAANSRFIAHARMDVPALLAHVAELREALKETAGAFSAVVEMLRKEAPGTHLNNHRFDALGHRANRAINDAGRILGEQP